MRETRQERILPILLYLFTAVTGLVDAVSYIALGHVFTANITGNIVFLGFALVGVPGVSALRCLTALAAFFIGALIGGRLATTLAPLSSNRWRMIAFGSEALFLLGATLASIGNVSVPFDPSRLYAVIILTALAMGLRNATVRKIAQPDLTTTVLTLTITGLAADSSFAGGSNPRWQRRVMSILFMFAGAAVGALLLSTRWFYRSRWQLPLLFVVLQRSTGADLSSGPKHLFPLRSLMKHNRIRFPRGLTMTKTNSVRQLAAVTGAALTGVLFFFIIVGVFGLQFAIAGLLIFAVVAVAIYRAFPEGEES